MKNYLKIFTLLALSFLFTNCSQDDALDTSLSNYVGFQIGPQVFTVDNGATQTFDITVAASETSNSDRTYNVIVDDASTLMAPYTVPSTVTIPAGSNVGTVTVSVTDTEDLGFVTQSLILDLPEDESDVDFGQGITLNFTETCLDTIVTFNLTLDTWPDETTWEIYDLSGTPSVIFSGGPYINPDDDFAELSFDFCLASGDYGVVVYDSYGDGGPTYSVNIGASVVVSETTLSGSNSSATFTVD